MPETLLEVKNLKTCFYTEDTVVPAVEDVSFSIARGQSLGVVGESGSGKSVTALSIMRLIPTPPGKITAGEVYFKGDNLMDKSEDEMRQIRGNNISMIFQEPITSLNPVYTVGRQICEAIILHQKLPRREASARALEMLKLVRIPLAEKRMNQYPHQLSGGMNQRVMIAMALSCRPELLIADEPTTALDVTIQAQIIELLKELKQKTGSAVMLITHDLGIIAELAADVLVMYCGRVVEYADVRTIFKKPRHPYTLGLLRSIPDIKGDRKKLYTIRGMVPVPGLHLKGCRFSSRCDEVTEQCLKKEPPLKSIDQTQVRCWKFC
ncbi:MAG: ABC transporter ATP-binding protein [Bacillota bacterium]